jgi:hypothetical protein
MSRIATNPENIKGKGFDKHPENINKEGRPRKLPDLDNLLIEILGDHVTKESMKSVLLALRKKAASGDIRAIELLLDRCYGKIKLQTEFIGKISLEPITGMRIIKDGSTN